MPLSGIQILFVSLNIQTQSHWNNKSKSPLFSISRSDCVPQSMFCYFEGVNVFRRGTYISSYYLACSKMNVISVWLALMYSFQYVTAVLNLFYAPTARLWVFCFWNSTTILSCECELFTELSSMDSWINYPSSLQQIKILHSIHLSLS